MSKTLDIIHREHQALAAVLQAMRFVVDGIAAGRFEPDFKLLSAMLDYVSEMPEKLHHPKEEAFLHRRLREKCPEAVPALDRLVDDHRHSPDAVRGLAEALVHYQARDAEGFPRFEAAAREFVASNFEHMNREEKDIMPLARKALDAADWAWIDAEFERNADPYKGEAGRFEALFHVIVNLVPAPMGLGPAGKG